MRAGWLQDITWSGSLRVQQYASAPMDPSTAAAWRDLYIGTVGAGASLTGLTFVAIALDPHQIERTPLLRLRAASALWCFVSVMFIGLAVLTPRPFTSVASVAVGVGGIAWMRLPEDALTDSSYGEDKGQAGKRRATGPAPDRAHTAAPFAGC